MKQKLDEMQQKAVTHGEGPLLVTAGPGSGKTTVITHHIKYLIENLGISPEQILVITFTKSAATEMRERFLRLMDEKNTKVVFGTFHAFFYQILRMSGGFTHDSILKEKEKYILFRDILKAHKLNFYENTFMEDLLAEISQAKNKGKVSDYEPVLLEKEIFEQVYKEYHNRMMSLNKIDFDDMVIRCYELFLQDKNALRKWQESFRYILVDEFQDINPMQYEIVRMLAQPHHNIFAVGDEDQSIYSFRGANPRISFQFLQDYPEAEQIFLAMNYRCHKDIVKGAKALISHNKNRFDKKIQALESNEKNTETEGLVVQQFLSEKEQYEAIAEYLKGQKEKGSLHNCAILFRTNMISPLFFSILKQYKISYQMKVKCKDWQENPVLKDIFAYFALAEGKLTRRNFYRVMNKPVRYITRDMVKEEHFTWEELEKNAKERFYVLEQLDKLKNDLTYISKLPVLAAISYIRRVMGYEKWLKEQDSKQLQEGMEMLETLRVMARECDTFEELWELMEDTKGNTYNTENDAVEIMTYHGAKGLEWPVVILPDVLEGITPYKRAQDKDEIEEERRMFYVAVTRAKKTACVYSLYQDEKLKKTPSSFIEELGFKTKKAP